jgi:hypothetical protein
MWLPVQSTNLSRDAEHYAQSHSSLVAPCCIDTAKALRRDAFLEMIRRLSSPPLIAMKASAHAFPAAQDVDAGSEDDGSRSAVVVACGNVETDAAGKRMAAGRRKNPLMH